MQSLVTITKRPNELVRTFNDRYPYMGPLFWIVSLQYLIMQVVVAAAWPKPGYDWSANAISDLGSTVCRIYNGRFVCSPEHTLMNLSFIVLGLTMVAGSWLLYHEFRRNPHSCYGFIAMALAGLGTVLVGFVPENVGHLHVVGALLAFGVGDFGLVLLATTIDMTRIMRGYTLISGLLGLSGLVLYSTGHFLGLGLGGMERVAGYPQMFWLIVFGTYIGTNHYRRLRNRS